MSHSVFETELSDQYFEEIESRGSTDATRMREEVMSLQKIVKEALE